MKKLFLIFFASFVILFLFSGMAQAISCSIDPNFVGPPAPGTPDHPDVANAIVPCGQYPDCPCEISDFFTMILRIYNFIVWIIALPLAGLMIVIGGVLMLVSGGGTTILPGGGSSGLLVTAKKILNYSIIGLILVFCSWLIIDVVLKTIGYTGTWNVF